MTSNQLHYNGMANNTAHPCLLKCVLLMVHPGRVKLSESRVRGYGRLGAQYLDHRQA